MGILPQAICDWYLTVYLDAYEWVELPNTLGMVYWNVLRMSEEQKAAIQKESEAFRYETQSEWDMV